MLPRQDITAVNTLKTLTKKTFVYDILVPVRQHRALRRWERQGRPMPPPPAFKQRLVRSWAERFGIRTLVETGTARGDMIAANRRFFERMYSIELDPDFYLRASALFSRYRHINVVPGNSGDVLAKVLEPIRDRCLFWLDGHAMVGGVQGELITPVRQELDAIFHHPVDDHVVLIDDARLFTGRGDYPSLEEVEELVLAAHPGWSVEVVDDVMRAYPKV